jgi:hypothetical protein
MLVGPGRRDKGRSFSLPGKRKSRSNGASEINLFLHFSSGWLCWARDPYSLKGHLQHSPELHCPVSLCGLLGHFYKELDGSYSMHFPLVQ